MIDHITDECNTIIKSLHCLQDKLDDIDAIKMLNAIFMSEVTSNEHPALKLPQQNLIVHSLSGIVQILDELKSETYRNEYEAHYQEIITEAYNRLIGNITTTMIHIYGPNHLDLWRWFEGLPVWIRSFIESIPKIKAQKNLDSETLSIISNAYQRSNPVTLAGGIVSNICIELFFHTVSGDDLNHYLSTMQLDKLVSTWCFESVDWNTIDRFLLQLIGEDTLTVVQIACGCKFITTSIR